MPYVESAKTFKLVRTGMNDQSSVLPGYGRTPYEKKREGSVRILNPASAGFVCPVTNENKDSQRGLIGPYCRCQIRLL